MYRKYGYKEGEGINFSRLGEDHKLSDMDPHEFLQFIEEMNKDNKDKQPEQKGESGNSQ